MVHRVVNPRSHEQSEVQLREEKTKRIVTGATFAGVLLVVFLLVVLIIQFVQIGVKNAEKKRLTKLIQEYQRLSEIAEEDIKFYKTEEGLRMLAVMGGYTKSPSGK